MLEKRVQNIEAVVMKYIEELQKSIQVDKVYLFGSYAYRKEHDYIILGKAALRVSPLIEARPYRPEDLKKISPVEFLSEIVDTGKLLYSKAT